MSYHVIIAQDRRSAERAAIRINNDIITETGIDADGMPTFTVTPQPPQLHSLGEKIADLSNPNLLYVAEWDGVSPFIIVHKGQIADLKMAYSGWPMISKEDWELQSFSAPQLSNAVNFSGGL